MKPTRWGLRRGSAIPTGGQGDNSGDSGNAYFTRRHRFGSTFVYDLPIGRNKKYFGANLEVGGWRVTGVTLVHSGPGLIPFFPSGLADPSGTFPSSRSVKLQRPDCNSGTSGYLSNPTTAKYFDVSAFSVPGSNIGRYGNCGVGILEGPGRHLLDVRGKDLRPHRAHRFTL